MRCTPQISLSLQQVLARCLLVSSLYLLSACIGPSGQNNRLAVPGADRPFPRLSSVPERPKSNIAPENTEKVMTDLEKEVTKAAATDAALRQRTKDAEVLKKE